MQDVEEEGHMPYGGSGLANQSYRKLEVCD